MQIINNFPFISLLSSGHPDPNFQNRIPAAHRRHHRAGNLETGSLLFFCPDAGRKEDTTCHARTLSGTTAGSFSFPGHDCRLCHPPGKEEGQTQRKVAGLFCRTFAAARGTPGGKSPCPGCFTCKTAGRACPDFAVGISPVPNGKGVGEWPAGKWTEPKNDNRARKPKRKALSTGKNG